MLAQGGMGALELHCALAGRSERMMAERAGERALRQLGARGGGQDVVGAIASEELKRRALVGARCDSSLRVEAAKTSWKQYEGRLLPSLLPAPSVCPPCLIPLPAVLVCLFCSRSTLGV